MAAPSLRLGALMPNFTADSTQGELNLYEYFGDSWGILFSHPADFTPVCTTELGEVAKRKAEFEARNVKTAAISCDSKESHLAWIEDIQAVSGQEIDYPIFCDESRDIVATLGMLDDDLKEPDSGLPFTVRKVFLVGPDKKIKLTLTYPAPTGRNFDEVLRVVDALQLTAAHSVATPVNWKQGGDVVILPNINNEQAAEKFGSFETLELPSGKSYLRIASCPGK